MSSGNDTTPEASPEVSSGALPEAAPAESVHQDDSESDDHVNMLPSSNPNIDPKSYGSYKGNNARLSVISQNYDLGEKGYLTTSEKHIRALDTENKGYLTNMQVAQVVEQTMDMREDNTTLRNWVLGLCLVVLLLAVSNSGTAWAANSLAKETSVNSDTGIMKVSGSETIVITEGMGVQLITGLYPSIEDSDVSADDLGSFHTCVSTAGLARMWQSTVENIPTAFILEDGVGTEDETVVAYEVYRSQSFFNTTHLGFKRHNEEGFVLFDFESTACQDIDRRRRERRQLLLEGAEQESNQLRQHQRQEKDISVMDNKDQTAWEEYFNHVTNPRLLQGHRILMETDDHFCDNIEGVCSQNVLVAGVVTDA
mmetsp:Transcript_10672/g.14125  ORF Transcript_10672/g.14125 Transcript_10672/m.14125 type:complete len:368 (-) Transcript_10672:90-1193(-)|eukprot:CAMPEP_0198144896 /NCGR_PEP_ID=MMETSP1443-20131203/19399_1 /TAXON_ID=186043 /ORGANISM="Entomoneis sp., Strain CCMP2396" /LENGTH=367 /DNA_ID=CAMNT_0043808385 /DNA_START=80 /DNA_END=1183 /DNA_ORIENTATION=+